MDLYQERLKNTIILCKDFRAVVSKYDTNETLFFLDPPYEDSPCISNWDYSPIGRNELLHVLRSIQGKFVCTYQNTPDICDYFKEFNQQFFNTTYTSSNRSKKTFRPTELIITNF